MIMWTLAGLACVIAVLYFVLDRIPRQRRLQRFVGRETLTEDQICGSYFGDSHISRYRIVELWNEIADYAEVPRGLMRPTDRFDTELAPLRGWEFGGETSSLTMVAQRRARSLAADIDLAQIHTVRDYIEKLGTLEQEKEQRAGNLQ